jgi:UDP-glucose 4-epimerase
VRYRRYPTSRRQACLDAPSHGNDGYHPFNNKHFYGATKIAGEAMARAFHHRYDLNFVGLRYMNV